MYLRLCWFNQWRIIKFGLQLLSVGLLMILHNTLHAQIAPRKRPEIKEAAPKPPPKSRPASDHTSLPKLHLKPRRLNAKQAFSMAEALRAQGTAESSQRALEYYGQALLLYSAIGDRGGEAAALSNFGSVYSVLGNKQRALKYFEQALPLYQAAKDRNGEATTFHNIGVVYSDLGERQKALEYYRQALPLYRLIGDRGGEARTLNNIGQVHSALGEKPQALKYFEQALVLYRAAGDRGSEAMMLDNLGSMYSALGEQQKALEYFERALSLLQATKIERHPLIVCRDRVEVADEFAVQISLTEKKTSSKTQVSQVGPDVTLTDKGLAMLLPKHSGGRSWKIDVILSAPDFDFMKGRDIAQIELPAAGDSTVALFQLRSKPTDVLEYRASLDATLWHEGKYLAKISREVIIYNLAKKDQLVTPPTVPAVLPGDNTNKDRSAKPASPRRGKVSKKVTVEKKLVAKATASNIAMQKEKLSASVVVLDDSKTADLSVFLLRQNPDKPEEARIIINSPFLQPVSVSLTIPKELGNLLKDRYQAFAQRSRSSKIATETAAKESNKEPNLAYLKGFGRELYDKFAPPAFKEAFWKLVEKRGDKFRTIQIYTADPTLPWELMRPAKVDGSAERDFLGVEFSVGRWQVQQTNVQLDHPPQSLKMDRLFVVAPQYQGRQVLPAQTLELEALRKVPGFNRLSANFTALQKFFLDMPQGIIHFAGHGQVKPSENKLSEFQIKLEGDFNLDLQTWRGMISRQTRTHPFFFFNACEVGQAQSIANFVDGWAPAVLEKGASGYIGALWPIGDQGAAEFATTFYEKLTEGMKTGPVNVSDVLSQTRRLFAEKGDPSYLAYVFYGDPHLQFQQAARPVAK